MLPIERDCYRDEGSMTGNFARLLLRICSVVNSRPQTLQRQTGEAGTAMPGA